MVTPSTKVAGTLRRAVRWSELTMIPGERHMECAYYFVGRLQLFGRKGTEKETADQVHRRTKLESMNRGPNCCP